MIRGLFFILLGLVISGASGVGGALLLQGALEQVATAEFSPVDAAVVSSQVTAHRGSKGRTNYTWDVEYVYDVAGATYRSTRKSFGSENRVEDTAQSAAAAHPTGTRMTAFYDPKDPARSVLRRGATSRDFLAPALVLGVFPPALWVLGFGVTCVRVARNGVRAGGLPIIDAGETVSVSVSGANPAATGLVICGVLVGFGVMLNGMANGASLSRAMVGFGFVALLAGGVGMAFGLWCSSLRIQSDVLLTFDRRRRTVTLPKSEGRTEFAVVSADIIEDFGVEVHETRGAKGGKVIQYRVHIDVVDERGRTDRLRIRTFHLQSNAASFESWCRERLLELGAPR